MTPAQRENLRGRSLQIARDVLGLDVPANGRHVACPMHGGVSFHYDPNRQRFHCFGCSPEYDGDIVDLTMRVLP